MQIFSVTKRVAAIRTRINTTFTFPDRFKGTVVEKWANYWRGLMKDYKDVAAGVVTEVRTKPRKTAAIAALCYTAYSCGQRNPDKEVFMRTLREWNGRMLLVPPSIQNAVSVEYLRSLEQAVNHNKIRLLSLGFFTLLWLDIYDEDDCTYPATCEYTRVRFWDLPERIVDVGFWNHFWHLEWKMVNYDVNYL